MRDGRDDASLEATLELLADPEAQARLRQGQDEVAAGDIVGGDELTRLLESLRSAR